MRLEGLSEFVNKLEKLEKTFSRPEDGLLSLAELMAGKARELAPVETGRLRDSIKTRREGKKAIVLAEAPYSGFVEFGTRPHVIMPRYKKVLRFEVDGKVVFATKVHHLGTSPRPFFRPAFTYAVEKLPEIMFRGD